jgi:predicted ester cyclase
MARPEMSVLCPQPVTDTVATLVQHYYGSWNNGSEALFQEAVSRSYTDRTPPAGWMPLQQGLADAHHRFRKAFPEGRVHVLQQVIAGDGIVSHLRVTGRFMGVRDGTAGTGQRIDCLATDIMRGSNGMIVENWHVEGHEALHRQIR